MGEDASAWFQPSQRPGEVAAADLTLTSWKSGTGTIDPGTNGVITLVDNTTSGTLLVASVSAALVNGTFTQDCHFAFEAVPDEGFPVGFEILANPPFDPIQFDPPIPIRTDESFVVTLKNSSGGVIEARLSAATRPA